MPARSARAAAPAPAHPPPSLPPEHAAEQPTQRHLSETNVAQRHLSQKYLSQRHLSQRHLSQMPSSQRQPFDDLSSCRRCYRRRALGSTCSPQRRTCLAGCCFEPDGAAHRVNPAAKAARRSCRLRASPRPGARCPQVRVYAVHSVTAAAPRRPLAVSPGCLAQKCVTAPRAPQPATLPRTTTALHGTAPR